MLSRMKVVCFFIAVFAFSVLFADIVDEKFLQPLDDSFDKETVISTEGENTSAYRISVFNGRLAVFDGDSKIPYKVYDTYIASLPEEDRKNLIKGIEVDTTAQLMKVIEEYTSWFMLTKNWNDI